MAGRVNALATEGSKAADVTTMRRCLLVMLDNLARDQVLGTFNMGNEGVL